MYESEALREFKDGMSALNAEDPRRALRHLLKSVELNDRNPFYLSYLGLALARADDRQTGQAEDLCYAALRMKRNQTELYLNMAEVYRRAGKIEDAIWTLNSGLEFTKHDARLARALSRLGLRRPPVLPFIGRKNFLNRQLGKLRHRLLPPRQPNA